MKKRNYKKIKYLEPNGAGGDRIIKEEWDEQGNIGMHHYIKFTNLDTTRISEVHDLIDSRYNLCGGSTCSTAQDRHDILVGLIKYFAKYRNTSAQEIKKQLDGAHLELKQALGVSKKRNLKGFKFL